MVFLPMYLPLIGNHLFPPFSVTDQVLKKIQVDQAEALLVAPVWPTKPWFNTFQDLLIANPYIVEPEPENLILPNHPGKNILSGKS